jgi:Holliday junction resolvasome RuvABC endonuclease subunit
MRIIAWDQASINSGWAIFEDGKYVDSGVITKSNKTPIIDRIPQMAAAICAKIKESGVDYVFIEGVQNQSNQKTMADLARLQGGIMMWCSIKKVPLKILMPTEWRRILKFNQGPKVTRDQLKQQSMDYVKEHFGLENISNDRAEAICIGAAASTLI